MAIGIAKKCYKKQQKLTEKMFPFYQWITTTMWNECFSLSNKNYVFFLQNEFYWWTLLWMSRKTPLKTRSKEQTWMLRCVIFIVVPFSSTAIIKYMKHWQYERLLAIIDFVHVIIILKPLSLLSLRGRCTIWIQIAYTTFFFQ